MRVRELKELPDLMPVVEIVRQGKTRVLMGATRPLPEPDFGEVLIRCRRKSKFPGRRKNLKNTVE